MHVERNGECAPHSARRVKAARDRRGRNHPARPAPWDSSCSAGPGRLYFSRNSSEISKRSDCSCRFGRSDVAHADGVLARLLHAGLVAHGALILAGLRRTRCAFSTGVCGKIPWPRFRMWPRPPVFSTASRSRSRTPLSGPSSTHGSTLPCSATARPSLLAERPPDPRANPRSARSRPIRARLSSKWLDAFRVENYRRIAAAQIRQSGAAWQAVRIRGIGRASVRPPRCRKAAPRRRPRRFALSDTAPWRARCVPASSRNSCGSVRSIVLAAGNRRCAWPSIM